MSIKSEKTVDGEVVTVEERTYRVEINTPNSPLGAKAFTAVAYRERIERLNGVPTKRVVLPPLAIPLNGGIQVVMSLVSGAVDTEALKSMAAKSWPLDGDGNLLPI